MAPTSVPAPLDGAPATPAGWLGRATELEPTSTTAPAPTATPVRAPSNGVATPSLWSGPTAPASARPATTSSASNLRHAPAAIASLLQAAHERGIGHARINLHPTTLGRIEVHVQTTPDGVSATVVADSPEAVRLLGLARDDLRRALESPDVELLSLEISLADDPRPPAAASSGLLELPGGLLADVLA